MSATSVGELANEVGQLPHYPVREKLAGESKISEDALSPTSNLVYTHDDEEPEFHARTYFAVAAMFLLNMVQVFALQGPPTVVSNNLCTNCLMN
jgi:hypothetical protein